MRFYFIHGLIEFYVGFFFCGIWIVSDFFGNLVKTLFCFKKIAEIQSLINSTEKPPQLQIPVHLCTIQFLCILNSHNLYDCKQIYVILQ